MMRIKSRLIYLDWSAHSGTQLFDQEKVENSSLCAPPEDFHLIQNIAGSVGYKLAVDRVKVNDIESLKKIIIDNNGCKNTPFYINYTMNLGFRVFPEFDLGSNNLLNLVELLKDTPGFEDLKWKFTNGWDLYGHREQARSQWFLEQIKHIPQKNIIMELTNYDVVDFYRDLLPESDIHYFTVFDIRWLSDNVYNELYVNDKEHKARHFLCLNRLWKPHRTQVWHHIMDNGLQKKFHHSYIQAGIYLEEEAEQISSEVAENDYRKALTIQDSPPHNIFKDCYAFLCTETFFYKYEVDSPALWWTGADINIVDPPDDWLSDTMFEHSYITEKCMKSAYCELPMLIAGLPNSLKTWRRLGFESFPEFFDESYDSETDDHKRMQMILAEVDKFCNRDIAEIHALYYSDTVQQKLKRNKQNLYKMIRENRHWAWTNFKYQQGLNPLLDDVFGSEE